MPDLPADATIATLVDTLKRPSDYLQNVYEHMWRCKITFGNSSVRIGITGEGKAPHYRIEYQNDRGVTAIFGIYRGLGHRTFEDLGDLNIGDLVLGDDSTEIVEVEIEIGKRETPKNPEHLVKELSWSGQAMTFEEVGALRMGLQRRRR